MVLSKDYLNLGANFFILMHLYDPIATDSIVLFDRVD